MNRMHRAFVILRNEGSPRRSGFHLTQAYEPIALGFGARG